MAEKALSWEEWSTKFPSGPDNDESGWLGRRRKNAYVQYLKGFKDKPVEKPPVKSDDDDMKPFVPKKPLKPTDPKDVKVVPGKPTSPDEINVGDFSGDLVTNPSLLFTKDDPKTKDIDESMSLADRAKKNKIEY
jgi:hypothetical protein